MPYLYKYKKADKYGLAILQDRAVYFAAPSKLNDVFDAQFSFSQLFRTDPDSYGSPIDNSICMRSFNAENLRIFSLSRRCNSAPMWGNYANDNKGFCVGFNDKLERYLVDSEHVRGIGAEYDFNKAIKQLRCTHFHLQDGMLFSQDIVNKLEKSNAVAVSLKHHDWSYEEEYRYFGYYVDARKNKGVSVTFKEDAISHIIFGINMSKKNKNAICKILCESTYKHVKLYQAIRAERGLEIWFQPLDSEGQPFGFSTPEPRCDVEIVPVSS